MMRSSQKIPQRMLRYALLAYVLCLRRFSEALQEQFPDSEAIFRTGLATREELQLLEVEADLGRVWHVPISWAMIMIRRFDTYMYICTNVHTSIKLVCPGQRRSASRWRRRKR